MRIPMSAQTAYAASLLFDQGTKSDTSAVHSTKSTLNLQPHPEGGYFVETDRDPLTIPNPFYGTNLYPNATAKQENSSDKDTSLTRNASTTIHYYLDPASPVGVFHRNKGRTVHTLHWGRGIYVIIHADEVDDSSSNGQLSPNGPKARIETFTVGPNIEAGEKVQWIVEGGKFKASFLIPDAGREQSEKGLLISETVVPGFEFMDHDFLTAHQLRDLVSAKEFEGLKWLFRKEGLGDVNGQN